MDLKLLGWVGVGSGLGGIARYLVSQWLTRGRFPVGTLAVNVVGSFLLGLLLFAHVRTGWADEDTLALLGTGVLGGFTTMSAFSQETVVLAGRGDGAAALIYVGLTLGACLVGAWLGRIVALNAFPSAT